MDAKIAAAKVQSDLQNLSDEELIEVYSSLKGKDEYKVQFNKLMHQAGKRLKGILEKDEQEQTNNAGHAAAQNDEDLLNSNLTQVEQFETVNVLDDKNKDFAETRAYLNNLSVVDEKGQKVDVTSNIIELVKIATAVELSQETKPFNQAEYNNRLRDNIDLSIYGILATEKLVTASAAPNQMSEVRKAVDSILSGKKQTVSTNSASAVMGNIIVTMRNQTDALSNKFSKLDVVNRLKDKVKKANDNLEKKLKQTYVKARTYAQILTEQGVWADVGVAAVAGVGGPVGMAAYGAWTFYRRAWPMIEAYKEEKKVNPEMKNFWQYTKQHKKDAVMAGLYTGVALASFGIAGAQVIPAMAQSATAAQTGSALVAPLTQAKFGLAAATVATRGVTDIAAEWNTENRNKAVKRAIFSFAAMGLGHEASAWMSNNVDLSASEAASSNVETPTSSSAIIDNNHNGIPDTIERPLDEQTLANPWWKQPFMTDSASVADNTPSVENADVAAASAEADTNVELPKAWKSDMGISPRQFNTLFGHPEQQFIGGRDALESAYESASRLSADQLSALGVKSPEELVYKFSRLEFQLGHKAPGELWVGGYAVDNAHPELGNFTDNKLKLEKLLNCQEIIQNGGNVQPSDLAGMKALLGHIDQNGQYHGIGDHVRTTAMPNGGILNDCGKVNVPGHTGGGRISVSGATPVPSTPAPVVTPVEDVPVNVVEPTEPAQPVRPTIKMPEIEKPQIPVVVTPIPTHIEPLPLVQPTEVDDPVSAEPVVDEPEQLEQPILKGKGGNAPLDNNINGEAARLGTNVGADADGSVVRADTPQDFSSSAKDAETTGTGKGNKGLNPFLLNNRINTFDL